MAEILILLVVLFPLAVTLAVVLPPWRAFALAAAPWAAVPALAAALLVEAGTRVEVPVLLLGSAFGLEAHQRIVLLFTALLWTAAGVYARAYHRGDPRRTRFTAFWLATLTANLGLVVAQDVASFYLFFVAMNLAAFALIIHTATPAARRAGGVYLVLVIVGEALILPGLWFLSFAADSPELADMAAAAADPGTSKWVLACIVLGFGIKAGALPLHVWLPLAHPVAPTPASAILSGVLIKAGLLAWLQLLPIEAAAPSWGALFAFLGIFGAFYGVAAGLGQNKPKTILAYSSISQMGLIMIAVGAALSGAGFTGIALTAVLLYAFHHALAKGALFLGVGVVEHAESSRARGWALALLALPAAALAGVPLTSGHLAKTAAKDALAAEAPWWAETIETLMPLAAVGTTLLLARFLIVMLRAQPEGSDHVNAQSLWRPWAALLAGVAVLAWTPLVVPADIAVAAFAPANLWTAAWPVVLGLAVAALAWRPSRRVTLLERWKVPEGDILPAAIWLGRLAFTGVERLVARLPRPLYPRALAIDANPLVARLRPRLDIAEIAMRRWRVAGLAMLIIIAALVVLGIG